jgi:hypothetical protein
MDSRLKVALQLALGQFVLYRQGGRRNHLCGNALRTSKPTPIIGTEEV